MKTNFSIFAFVFIAFFSFVSFSYSQTPETAVAIKWKEYVAIVEKLKKEDKSADFGQLRRAYVEWKVAGGTVKEHPQRGAMVKAFESNNHADAVKFAEELLDEEFYNHNIFGAVSDSYEALKNKEKADYYKRLHLKAQHGLFLSGDGKSPETAYYVLSIPEEYRVMRELGITTQFQSLEALNGQAFDVLSGKDSKGNQVNVYFNICFFFRC